MVRDASASFVLSLSLSVTRPPPFFSVFNCSYTHSHVTINEPDRNIRQIHSEILRDQYKCNSDVLMCKTNPLRKKKTGNEFLL